MPEHEFSLTDLFPHKNIIVDSVVTREKMGQRKDGLEKNHIPYSDSLLKSLYSLQMRENTKKL